jgi:DNA-binding NtrC family response regulator
MARENILVVDDEPDMRDALTAALRREGLCISTAANGVEALEKVQGQSFDLIITDVRMPRMGGLALLQELKRTSPTIPVIMMTGYGRIEDAVEAMKAGAFDYLLKPFSLEDLKVVVTKALTPPQTPARPRVEPSRQEEQEYLEAGGNIERPIVTDDSRMLQVIELAKEAASSKATVLIQGESGTGKEVLAR